MSGTNHTYSKVNGSISSPIVREDNSSNGNLEAFICRTPINIDDRYINYNEIIKHLDFKSNKKYCPKLYKIENEKPIFRLGSNIILKNPIGKGGYGIIYLSSFKDSKKSDFKYAIKLFKEKDNYGLEDLRDLELEFAKKVTRLVINKICPHFLITYNTIKCNNFDYYKSNKDSEFSGTHSSSRSNSSLQAYKNKSEFEDYYPHILTRGSNIHIIISELANGDLNMLIDNGLISSNIKLFSNTLTQIFMSLAFFNYKLKSFHLDTNTGNFLYYKIKPGGYFHYKILDKDYYIKNIGYLWLLCDFGRSSENFDMFKVNTDFNNLLTDLEYIEKLNEPPIKDLINNLLPIFSAFNAIKYTNGNYRHYLNSCLNHFVSIGILHNSISESDSKINSEPYYL
jgi:hypothetical protein